MGTDYLARAKKLANGVCSGDEAMRTVILDMIRHDIPESEAKRAIQNICEELFDYEGLDFINDYLELRLKAAVIDPVTDSDPIYDVEGLARYLKRKKTGFTNTVKNCPIFRKASGGN